MTQPPPPPGFAPPPPGPFPPQPLGQVQAQPPRRRSRTGGILLAVGGVLTLLGVFVLPWERAVGAPFGESSTATLAELRTYLSRDGVDFSWHVPFYTALVAGVLALLAGVLAAATGVRATNVVGALVGLLASFLAFATPVYDFFRVTEGDFGEVEWFMEFTAFGFYLMYVFSLVLLAGAIAAMVGAIRSGKPRRRPGPPHPGPPHPGPTRLPPP